LGLPDVEERCSCGSEELLYIVFFMGYTWAMGYGLRVARCGLARAWQPEHTIRAILLQIHPTRVANAASDTAFEAAATAVVLLCCHCRELYSLLTAGHPRQKGRKEKKERKKIFKFVFEKMEKKKKRKKKRAESSRWPPPPLLY
jgi:hypothetical protein